MSKKKMSAYEYTWTSELAYALGLFVTDGCLSNDGRHVVFRSIDLEQMKNFQRCFKFSKKIEKTSDFRKGRKMCYRIQAGDVRLYRWLESLGLTPCKTFSLKEIPVPDDYFADFLRGHLDGDGTITTYADRYSESLNAAYVYFRFTIRFISASYIHIVWLRNTIQRLYKINGDLFEDKSKGRKHSLWQLKFMKKESLKLVSFLYYSPDVVCLSRKRDKAMYAVEKISQIKRKVYTFKNSTNPYEYRENID